MKKKTIRRRPVNKPGAKKTNFYKVLLPILDSDGKPPIKAHLAELAAEREYILEGREMPAEMDATARARRHYLDYGLTMRDILAQPKTAKGIGYKEMKETATSIRKLADGRDQGFALLTKVEHAGLVSRLKATNWKNASTMIQMILRMIESVIEAEVVYDDT